MSKISPEPWERNEDPAIITDADGVTIAWVYAGTDNVLANARAIVEVPNMITALKDYQEVLEICIEFPERKKRVDELLSRIEGSDDE